MPKTPEYLSPFVHWAQNKTQVFLKVDLRDVQNPEINLEEDRLEFVAYGQGAKGPYHYSFTLPFYTDIDIEESKYRVLPRHVDFTLAKHKHEWWPKVQSGTQKFPWLKVDFDRYRSEDDEDEIAEQVDQISQLLQKERRQPVQTSRQLYLFLYNMWQFIGYSYILFALAFFYYRDGPDSMLFAYERVHTTVKLCQGLQFFEILHPLFGFTKGSVWLPTLQVGGRALVLFLLLDGEPRMQTKPVTFYLFVVWSLIEIFRYPYYMTRVYKLTFETIQWFRYTAWIPLYPLGFLCEGVIILRDIPYFEETEKFSILLPNSWNFSFYFPTVLRIYLLLLYFPVAYSLMSHMYRLRAKKIGPKLKSN